MGKMEEDFLQSERVTSCDYHRNRPYSEEAQILPATKVNSNHRAKLKYHSGCCGLSRRNWVTISIGLNLECDEKSRIDNVMTVGLHDEKELVHLWMIDEVHDFAVDSETIPVEHSTAVC